MSPLQLLIQAGTTCPQFANTHQKLKKFPVNRASKSIRASRNLLQYVVQPLSRPVLHSRAFNCKTCSAFWIRWIRVLQPPTLRSTSLICPGHECVKFLRANHISIGGQEVHKFLRANHSSIALQEVDKVLRANHSSIALKEVHKFFRGQQTHSINAVRA